ncbi:MAG: GIY-YIG nuclease family protein [Nitrospinae bacterium]|nr:GIY-YIG nuclease family protein [Nitrospinota bacterium]
MDKQHIIDEIKRTAEKNGGVPLGTERFFAETGICKSDWFGKYWARWGDALIEAGYEPNKLQGSYEDEWVIEKLISFIKEKGKYPASGDLRLKAKQDNKFPSHNVFSRIGKKSELARKIIEYCKSRDDLDDVVEICKPIAVANKSESNISNQEQLDIGYVYLMKSGRYYKIGRTDAIGRREYELGIQLPDKVITVHTIKTDDRVGIEAYWHKRFQDRRRNGEWFELSAEDVKAFKRRKFM